MKKIKFLFIIIVSLMMSVGCDSKEEQKNKDEIYSNINSEYINLTMVKPKTINPILNKDKSVAYITNLIYDSLFTIDENYNVVPQLVEEYGISQDGMSIDIKLKNAKWHDGENVTSRDVKFSIDFIQSNSESTYYKLAENISSVSILNEKSLTINFKEKYPFSIDTLIFPIISEAKLGKIPNDEIKNNKNNFVGNGPYKVEKYEERGGMILTKNKEYYGEILDTTKDIKVGIVPDQESQISMVMALDSDIARIQLNDLSKFYEKEFKIKTYEGRSYESIIFNYDNPILKDINFRKAISHSINKEKIVQEGYMDDATLINFPLNSESKYYNKDISYASYNKEKAKQYLDKVNLKENDNNKKNKESIEDKKSKDKEIKNKENKKQESINKNLNLDIVVNKSNTERIKVAHIISEDLKSVGIKTTIHELENEQLEDAISSKKYDLALVGWELSIVPDAINIIRSSGYSDEKLENYIQSLYDATTQLQVQEIYKSIQKYVNDSVAFISLGIRDEYIVTNKRLIGEISPNDFDVYEGIVNLDIKNK